jgi:hypothetical protein
VATKGEKANKEYAALSKRVANAEANDRLLTVIGNQRSATASIGNETRGALP